MGLQGPTTRALPDSMIIRRLLGFRRVDSVGSARVSIALFGLCEGGVSSVTVVFDLVELVELVRYSL